MKDLSIIKTICDTRNISIIELAKKVGISSVGLYRVINTNSTKVSTLEKIATALDVPINIFFDEINDEHDIIVKKLNIQIFLQDILIEQRNRKISELLNELLKSSKTINKLINDNQL